jgi:hypothetical protein
MTVLRNPRSIIDADTRKRVLRRHFFGRCGGAVGAAALASLLNTNGAANPAAAAGAPLRPHFAARAKRVIYLFMSGGPSHVDTFDHKPELQQLDGQPIPASFIKGVHFAQISRRTKQPLLKASPYKFQRHGQSGTLVSELLPNLASMVDEMAVVRSLRTTTFNHDPAVCLLNTGHSRVGRPTMGAWLSYGLGNESDELPSFVVLTSGVKVQPLLTNYWTSGFLPTRHQGVEFRRNGDAVLFLSDPAGIDRGQRRKQIDLINWMNRRRLDSFADPEIETRIEQYELAFRMQAAAPEAVDLRQESAETLALYGADPNGSSFANNCLLARRLVERGVRYVQLYDMGWDSHGDLVKNHNRQCRAIDKAAAGLLRDLKQRGLLEETLVIWGGEFGRTPVAEGGGNGWGRDHHPHGFTMWMAGGGIRGGVTHGATDEFGFHAAENKVDVHNFHATALHLMGIDHARLTYRHQGRDFRLTDIGGRVIKELLA